MILYAAIDLRGGRVVQLVGGRPEDERVSWPDPAGVARRWADAGFAALHVVDLDAALRAGENREAIERILDATELPVQVGGGVRDEPTIEWLFEAGASRAIVGTRAVEDPAWLEVMASRWPQRIVVAADVRDGIVLTRGWTARTQIRAVELLARLSDVPLAAVLVTDVGREGQMVGVDEAAFRGFVAASAHPLIAAGGIGGAEDVRTLAGIGAAGAVLGMSLYTGAVDASLAREYAA